MLLDRRGEVGAVVPAAADQVGLAAGQPVGVGDREVVGDRDLEDPRVDGGDVQAGGGERGDQVGKHPGVDVVAPALQLEQAGDDGQGVPDGGGQVREETGHIG